MNPWDSEPDALRFKSHGLKCLIIRHSELKHLCGYVRLPHGKLRDKVVRANRHIKKMTGGIFSKKYTRECGYNIPELSGLEVHGGLTYARSNRHYLAKGGIWVGFDCAHWNDLSPGMLDVFNRISMVDSEIYKFGSYKTIEYVRRECEGLAAQIAKMVM